MRRHLIHALILMTAQGHLLFSVSCTLIAHKLQLTPALADATLWQTIPAALASALLPDLDHPKSVLGQRLPWISKPLSRLFGHRGFTHSLLAVAAAIWGLNQSMPPGTLPMGVKDALIVGYLSHLLGDWLTPAGIPLLAHQAPLPAAWLATQEWRRHGNRILYPHPACCRLVVGLVVYQLSSAFKITPHPQTDSVTMRGLSARASPFSPK